MDEFVEATQLVSKWRKRGLNLDGRYRVSDTVQQTQREESKDPGSNPAHLAINSRTEDLPLSIQY